MITVTPHTLVQQQLDTILGYLPGVFDGDVEAIHDARIATRRLREVLPLGGESYERGFVRDIRKAGRNLGRVRDLDVMRCLLDTLGERLPGAGGAVALAKRGLKARQMRERRRMVEKLEGIDLKSLRKHVGRSGHTWVLPVMAAVHSPSWVSALSDRIATRAAEAAAAIEHATGIYFADRAHRARIGIKKLRYVTEVAVATGVWRPRRVLKDLRRVQGLLGDIHDAEVLIAEIDDLAGPEATPADIAAVKHTLEDDIARSHAEYLRKRDRVLTICEFSKRRVVQGPLHAARPLIAASIVTVPLLLVGSRRAH